MLPEALSNGLCSLKPDVDRLTMSALMNLDEKGRITGSRFANSVIHSSRRFTYEDLEDWYEGRAPLREGEEKRLGETLAEMKKVALLRRKLREQRGALDFDFPETKVQLDEQGKPVALTRRTRLFTHQLIEEFMLAANESRVATELRESGYPVLYRVHEEPDEEKLGITLAFLGKLKLGVPKNALTPKDLQQLMLKAEKMPEKRLVHTLILRSLRLARYSPGHDMHFGLALDDYCHFTSPIRRVTPIW